MKVAVGSKNPVKIKAVRLAFQTVWPDRKWSVSGVEAASGVSVQPMSDIESITGARNRAILAVKKLRADFGVGLEGGLQKIGKEYFDCGWVVVLDQNGNEGMGSTARILVPKKLIKMIKRGRELGEINDMVFGKRNSKQAEGYFGTMTNNAITRLKAYKHGVIVALSRFIHPNLFSV